MNINQDSTIEELIDYVTSEFLQTPDINAQIEISSRFTDNRKDLVIGLRMIDAIMKKGKIKRKYLALCLIEVCSKNGDIKFHEQVTK